MRKLSSIAAGTVVLSAALSSTAVAGPLTEAEEARMVEVMAFYKPSLIVRDDNRRVTVVTNQEAITDDTMFLVMIGLCGLESAGELNVGFEELAVVDSERTGGKVFTGGTAACADVTAADSREAMMSAIVDRSRDLAASDVEGLAGE